MATPIPLNIRFIIGGVSVLAAGGFIAAVSIMNHKPTEQKKVAETSTPVPSVISDALNTLISTSVPANTTSDSSTKSSVSTSTKKSSTTTKTESIKVSKVLSASVSTATTGSKFTISVVANQPIIAGFSPLASSTSAADYSTAKTMIVSSPVNNQNLVIRTMDGQELEYHLSLNSNTSGNSSAISSSSSASSTSVSTHISAN